MTERGDSSIDEASVEVAESDPDPVAAPEKLSGGHLSIEFFTKETGLVVPNTPLSVPNATTTDQLNGLLLQLDAKLSAYDFDFLINDLLVRERLVDFVSTHSLGVESVLRIECVRRQPPPTAESDFPHDDWIAALTCAPNDRLITGCYDNTVSIWNVTTGVREVYNNTRHSAAVKCVALMPAPEDPSGPVEFFSGGHDQTVYHWKYEPSSGCLHCIRALRGHERAVECAAVNGDGTRLATGGFDSLLKIWDTETEAVESQPTTSSKRRKRTTSDDDDTPQNATPMVTLGGHRENISAVCWSPKEAAECVTSSFDHTIAVWDLELAGPKCSLVGARAFTGMSVNPFNGLIITSSVDKYVRLWDARNKDGSMVRRVFASHSGWVSDVAWSPSNENHLVSCSYDGVAKLWDVRSPCASLFDLGTIADKLFVVDWSLAARIAVAGADAHVRTFCYRNAIS